MNRITVSTLRAVGACTDQAALFAHLYPRGITPTVEHFAEAAAQGLDVWWAYHLLPAEGPGSQRAYALWCAEQVAHLSVDRRVAECLAVVLRCVENPVAVTDQMLAAAGPARAAAWAAVGAARAAAWAAVGAAEDVAGAAARAAVWAAEEAAGAAAWDAARAAQMACLAQLLAEAPEPGKAGRGGAK